MHLALWIVAGLLAVVYLAGGVAKLVVPRRKMAAMGHSARWVENVSSGGLKAIGALEVLAALGLVLPAVTGVAPVLVPLAALGLVLIMTGAAVLRYRRGELKLMVLDLVYLVLAAFVAVGRFVVPFTG